MSSSAHKRRHKHEEHEEHVNHERWLVSYADMLTVLMALFIVLFALSQVDQLKFAQFRDGFNKGTSSSNLAVSGAQGIMNADNGQDPIALSPLAGGNPMQAAETQDVLQQAQKAQTQSDLEAAKKEVEDYRAVEKQLNDALTAKDDQDQVTYRITSDGLVVGLVADNVFFANASADVEPKGLEVLSTIGPILAALPNGIAVQGHTNSLPLSSTIRYRDNWDLSSARANTVLNFFRVNNGVSPQRLSSTGYADSRPLYPDSDPKAMTGNRRVDLTVASPSKDAVKALLPQVAAGTAEAGGPPEVSTGAGATVSTVSATDVAAATTVSAVANALPSDVVPNLTSGVTH